MCIEKTTTSFQKDIGAADRGKEDSGINTLEKFNKLAESITPLNVLKGLSSNISFLFLTVQNMKLCILLVHVFCMLEMMKAGGSKTVCGGNDKAGPNQDKTITTQTIGEPGN